MSKMGTLYRKAVKTIFCLPVLLVVAVMGTMVSSCDVTYCENENYVHELVGNWELYEYDGYPVSRNDVNYYNFYDNDDGYYCYFDNRGNIVAEPFTWSTGYGRELYIEYFNSYLGRTSCYYERRGSYLYFSEYRDFRNYNVYRVAY